MVAKKGEAAEPSAGRVSRAAAEEPLLAFGRRLSAEIGAAQALPARPEAAAEAVKGPPEGCEEVVCGDAGRDDAERQRQQGAEHCTPPAERADVAHDEWCDDVEGDQRRSVQQVDGQRRAGDAVDERRAEAQAPDPHEEEQGAGQQPEAAIGEPHPGEDGASDGRGPAGEQDDQAGVEQDPDQAARAAVGQPAAAAGAQRVAHGVEKEKRGEVLTARQRRVAADRPDIVADEGQRGEQGDALLRRDAVQKTVDYGCEQVQTQIGAHEPEGRGRDEAAHGEPVAQIPPPSIARWHRASGRW